MTLRRGRSGESGKRTRAAETQAPNRGLFILPHPFANLEQGERVAWDDMATGGGHSKLKEGDTLILEAEKW